MTIIKNYCIYYWHVSIIVYWLRIKWQILLSKLLYTITCKTEEEFNSSILKVTRWYFKHTFYTKVAHGTLRPSWPWKFLSSYLPSSIIILHVWYNKNVNWNKCNCKQCDSESHNSCQCGGHLRLGMVLIKTNVEPWKNEDQLPMKSKMITVKLLQ